MASSQILWVRLNDEALSFRNVAEVVFRAFGVSHWEERESLNCPNDHYFAGYAENASLQLIDRDEEQGEHEYRYQVAIVPSRAGKKGTSRIPDSAADVAAVLAKNGFSVFRPSENWAQPDWDGSGTKYPD
jgi:hypothetical protein